ncbi:acyltransferase family protein [Paenibacillus solani]|uniref:acyltransferase family protein n=1 Tax=Paenibacillus solani TaxID=1705565 RepID=UPI003D2708A2
MSVKKFGWIDFLKGLSILAVVFDHLFGIVYHNQSVHLLTEFSVTAFIFLAGVTSVISIERNKMSLRDYQIRRVKGVLIPYLIATAIYVFVNLHYNFDLKVYWNALLNFNASAPFYFIAFFIQLVIIAPYLYKLLVNKRIWFQLLSLIIVYLIARLFTHNSVIGEIYGGGGKLLGGSYLFVFFLGMLTYMLYKKHSDIFNKNYVNVLLMIVSIIALGVVYFTGWLNLGWTNPPNKYTIIYSLSVMVFGFSLFMLLAKWRVSKTFLSMFETLGKYSLYIFLYHWLGIDYAKELIGVAEINFFNTICLFVFAVVFPTIIGMLVKYRWKIVNNKKILGWVLDTNISK